MKIMTPNIHIHKHFKKQVNKARTENVVPAIEGGKVEGVEMGVVCSLGLRTMLRCRRRHRRRRFTTATLGRDQVVDPRGHSPRRRLQPHDRTTPLGYQLGCYETTILPRHQICFEAVYWCVHKCLRKSKQKNKMKDKTNI